MSKICIVTATRAEYGLLKPVISGLIDKKNDVRIVVSGAHLSEKYGLTYKEIERDGFEIDAKIDMKLNSGTPAQISNSMANAIVGFANYFQKRRPDCVVILGDRYDVRYLPPKYGKDYNDYLMHLIHLENLKTERTQKNELRKEKTEPR